MARPQRNPDIKYINPNITDFELPEFKGTRYVARIPDTLDLVERAAQSVHVMTASTDPEANAEIYYRTLLSGRLIVMRRFDPGRQFCYSSEVTAPCESFDVWVHATTA